MSAAGTVAASCCGPMYRVGTSVLSITTRNCDVILSPDISSGKSAVFAKTFAGEMFASKTGGVGVGVGVGVTETFTGGGGGS